MISTTRLSQWLKNGWYPSTDRTALVSLIVLVVVLKIIILAQQPILARDGIMQIQFACDLNERPWATAIRENPYHPWYAITLAAGANFYQFIEPEALTPTQWQWCGHLSASLAGILLVFPLYGLSRCFFAVRTAWLAGLLFLILPAVAQNSTDTLTESWYLLFQLTALWAMVQGVRSQRSSWFVMSGLLGGMAYLVRVEALILPAALFIWVFVHRWKQRAVMPASASLRNLGIVVTCFLLPPLPYMVTIGKLSNRPVVQTVAQHTDHWQLASSEYLFAWERLQDGVNGLHRTSVAWLDAISLFTVTHGRAGQYFLWPLAIIGLLMLWRTKRHDPAFLLTACVSLLHGAMLLRLAHSAGYLSERHTLLFLVLATQCSAVGLIAVAQWLRRIMQSQSPYGRMSGVILGIVVLCLCLPKAVQPLHQSQEGHRQAGLWLAEHLEYADQIIDPYHWASFYAGLEFSHRRAVLLPERTLGVIDPRDADLNRQRDWQQAGLQAQTARTIWSWPSTNKPKLIIREVMTESTARSEK